MSRKLTTLLTLLVLVPASCGTLGGPAEPVATAPPAPMSFAAWAARGDAADVRSVSETLRRVRTGLLPAEIDHVARVIVEECERTDLSPELVLAVISVESSGYNFARSKAGALGLMQLRPLTGRAVARRVGVSWRGRQTLFDAGTNVRLGISYLRELIDRYGEISTALAAYNWGPTRVSAMIRRGKPVPVVYPSRVLAAFEQTRNRDA
jgi:soluble lytic murein transglycosylase